MKFERIAIADIAVPERLRAVEEEHAIAIAQSVVEHGLINPITVRPTPAAKGGTWTLVAGAHRLRAVSLNNDDEIDAVIIQADKDEAQLVEITENLFRNELSVIDRSIFVQSYRDIWEQKHGKIQRGGDQKSKGQDGPLIASECVVDLIAAEAEAGFAQHVADRLGISKRSAKRLNQIARHLHPDVRSAIRGTPIADNQSALLKLAKMEPVMQRQTAVALKAEGPDLKKALAAVEGPKPKVDAQSAAYDALVSAWARASRETKIRFVDEVVGISAWEPR